MEMFLNAFPEHQDLNNTNSTNATTSTEDESSSSSEKETVDQRLWIYWSPFTFLIGSIGNTLILLVLCRFRKYSDTIHTHSYTHAVVVYFAFMAIADIVFIASGIVPEWLQAMEYVDVGETHEATCKLEKFIFYTSGDIAVWIIVVINLDRCFAVCFPMEDTKRCIRVCLGHPLMIAILLSAIACIKNVHVFWTRGAVYESGELQSNCGRPKAHEHFENYVRPWIVFVVVALVPSIIIIICNICIMVTLCRMRKFRAHNLSNHKDFMQTIIMCLSASIAFILCIFPSIIIYIGRIYWTDPDKPEENPHNYDIAKAVANQLAYVNHAINFILYCSTGKKFRDTMKGILTCSKPKKDYLNDHAMSGVSQSTYTNSPRTPSRAVSMRNSQNIPDSALHGFAFFPPNDLSSQGTNGDDEVFYPRCHSKYEIPKATNENARHGSGIGQSMDQKQISESLADRRESRLATGNGTSSVHTNRELTVPNERMTNSTLKCGYVPYIMPMNNIPTLIHKPKETTASQSSNVNKFQNDKHHTDCSLRRHSDEKVRTYKSTLNDSSSSYPLSVPSSTIQHIYSRDCGFHSITSDSTANTTHFDRQLGPKRRLSTYC